MGRFIAVSMLSLWLMQLDAVAQAQTLRLALFKTGSSASEDAQLAAALDPVLQTEIGRMPQISVAALPPLDLPSLQLALDCVGDTPSCLAVATERSKVNGLVSPSLARSDATLVLSLLLYDQQQSAVRVVTRNFVGDASDALVIEGARSLVQELFGQAAPADEPPVAEPQLAEPMPAPEPTAAEPELQPLAAEEPSSARGSQSLLLPIVLGAAGVGAIAIGIGFGVASNSAESSYAKTHVATSADAQRASDQLSTAQTQSSISNVAIVLGAASCVAGGVVFFLQHNRRPDTAPSAQVAVGPGFIRVSGGF